MFHVKHSFLFYLLSDDLFLSAHIWLQSFRDIDGTVFVVIVLQERDQHPRRSDDRVVQGVRQIIAFFAFDTDLQSSGLGITQVRAGTDFKIFLLARRPCLDVAGFDFQVGQVAGAAFQRPYWDIHG